MCANFGNLEKKVKDLEAGEIDSFHSVWCPCDGSSKGFLRLRDNYKRYSEYLPGKNIYFVGNAEVGKLVDESALGERIKWIDENTILPFDVGS